MKKIIKRKCVICEQVRRTTNTETPFVCEDECLRDEGRKLLLDTRFKTKSLAWRGAGWILSAIVLGILLGKFVF